MRRIGVLLLLVAFSTTACGTEQDPGLQPGGDAGDEEPTTSITLEVRTDADAEPKTLTLECEPTGGDHPQAEQACDALASAGADVFEPVPADQACTMIYGGPQTATVKGTVDGADVDATFTRENGCEVDRWEQLGTTFFDVPLQ